MAQTVLVSPPLTDFTVPPESLARLKAAATSAGLDSLAIDLNLSAFLDLATPARVGEWTNSCEARISALVKRLTLTYWEQQELMKLGESLADGLKARETVAELVSSLRDPDRHHQAAIYAQAIKTYEGVQKLLSSLCFPFQFAGNEIRGPFVTDSAGAIDRFRAVDPFRHLYDKLALDLAQKRPSSIIVVIDEPGQWLPACSLAAVLRTALPDTCLIAAGSFIGRLQLGAEPVSLGLVIRYFSAWVGGDEAVAVAVAEMAHAQKFKTLTQVTFATSVATHGKGKDPVATVATPDYSDLTLGDYLSPELVMSYRVGQTSVAGAFNFLDWHTAHERVWREPSEVLADLATLKERHGVRLFQLTGGRLPLSWLEAFATAAHQANLGLRFSASVALEHAINAEQALALKNAGCVALLANLNEAQEAISKQNPTTNAHSITAELGRSLEQLAHAGIATQVQLVMGLPSSEEQLRAALDFLRSHQQEIDLVGADTDNHGRLLISSRVLGEVEHFFYAGDELRCYPELPRQAALRARFVSDVERCAATYTNHRWPFQGALGSAHSLIAFEKLGRKALRDGHRVAAPPAARPLSEGDRVKLSPTAKMLWIPYQLSVLKEIADEERELVDHELRRRQRDLSADKVVSFSAREDLKLRAGQRSPHVLAPGMSATEITLPVADLLGSISEQFLPCSQLLARVSREAREPTRRLLSTLHQYGALITEFQTRREQDRPPRSEGGHGGGGANGGSNGGHGPGGGGKRRRRRRGRGRGGEGLGGSTQNTPPVA